MNERQPDGNGRLGSIIQPRRMWLSDLSIRQPVFITMVVVAVMVVGGIFYSRMGLDLFPDVSLPVTVVQTVYPGASPEEVERSVTKPIEDAVSSINGVETVRSTTADSLSTVIVEFKMDMDPKTAEDEVRAHINTIRNTLPSDVTDPVVLRFDPSAAPVLSIAVADKTGQQSQDELRTLVEDVIKPRLEQVSGVAAVDVTGGLVREVQVNLRAAQLQAYGVTPQQVVQALQSDNVDIPAGRVPDGQREQLLRLAGEVRSVDQLGDIPVVMRPGTPTIKVKDLATVEDGYAEVRALSRLDGQPSIIVGVRKQSGTNTVSVADGVKTEMAQLEQENPGLTFAVGFDQSTFTREAVQDVQFSLLLGAILAGLVVLVFFRDLRNTIVTIAGLPVILMGTAAVLYVLGVTQNMITLMAVSLSVGMLIDDAIVVRENIFRHMERGEEPKVAAGHGTAEIALAVVAVSSTIVAVFLPIAFTEGIAGKFLRDFGLTVSVAIVISLIEAFTLAPMLSAYFFKQIDPSHRHTGRIGRFDRLFTDLNDGYRRLLRWSLHHRLIVVIVGIAAFAASLAVVPLMTLSFVHEADQGEFSVAIQLPPGALITETDQAARAVETILRQDPAVAHVYTMVGSSDGAVERATVDVRLQRRGLTEAAINRLRPEIAKVIDETTFTIDRQSASAMLGGGGAVGAVRSRPIQFSVQGADFAQLDQVSADLVARLKQVPGAVDVDRSIKAGKPGKAIVLDRAKASDLGISNAMVGSTVRMLVNGQQAGVFRSENKDVDVVVRLAEADRANPADILRLPITTSGGSQVPISSVATLVESVQPDQIYRENKQRQVVVGASYLGRSLGEVLAEAEATAKSTPVPAGVKIELSGQAKYQAEMFNALGLALGLSVLFVYMILASQFGSFVHPFTIMLALPFSIIGALLSLFLGGFDLDMLGMIGIILLMGLVTKNSILLVEFINQLRRQGYGLEEAILEAGPTRLRPILMTTLAMIFGMVPIAAGIGAGAELRQPMGVSVIGGLLTSTLLTLIVVPVAYTLIDGLGRLVTGRRRSKPAVEVEERTPPMLVP